VSPIVSSVTGKHRVSLPTSAALFPAGKGSEIANANCLICHSAGMALRQPPLTVDEWHAEIIKMKAAFGTPIPADQIGELAGYLGTVDGREGASQPGTLDSQGNGWERIRPAISRMCKCSILLAPVSVFGNVGPGTAPSALAGGYAASASG
jgi:hypothetical protein